MIQPNARERVAQRAPKGQGTRAAGEPRYRREVGTSKSTLADELTVKLRAVAASLPDGGEDRPGQRAMAHAVARAVALERHLVVQAGTGTGKSLAYLLPLVLAGRKTVVATATKHLQDQLAEKDLPQLCAALGGDKPIDFAVLKGRANYICRQRVVELTTAADAGSGHVGVVGSGASAPLFDAGEVEDEEVPGPAMAVDSGSEASAEREGTAGEIRRLVAWAEVTESGERSDLPFEPSGRAWAAVSVTARECPGAFHCPSGPDCFAELAKHRAAAADVVVVNTHLYAAHLAADGAVLPEHDVVVFDEAHAVEDVMTDGLSLEITPGRLRAAATSARSQLHDDDGALVQAVADTADRLDAALAPLAGRRVLRDAAPAATVVPSDALARADAELRAILELASGRLSALAGALRRAGPDSPGGREEGEDHDSGARRTRTLLACSHLLDDLRAMAAIGPERVAWVEASGPGGRWRALRAAPVDVGAILAERLWPSVSTAVLTSATVPPMLTSRLGLPGGSTDLEDVGSPFPYETNALLFCAAQLPDRRTTQAEPALHDELAALIEAAGGRTLALFTSWRAMAGAVEALRSRLPFPVLAQGELPKPALLAAFTVDESACLFATMSFWQGVDVPGPTLSLVTLDRLPFPRPDDPLLEARRERAGVGAFRQVDLPRAATLLAQGAGRLIRSARDRGVVAVLDRRLATAGYGAELRSVLPPMAFTTKRSEAEAFLAGITGTARPPAATGTNR